MTKKVLTFSSILALICLALVGWAVFFTQNPVILAKARFRYIQAVRNNTKLDNGPCLGEISPDWVLDIAHIPRQIIDDKAENQCASHRGGKTHHLVEMSPRGEIIIVR